MAQQTPSTQKSLRHWLFAEQVAPLGRSVPLTIGASVPPSPVPPNSTITIFTTFFSTVTIRAVLARTTPPGPSASTSQRTLRPA